MNFSIPFALPGEPKELPRPALEDLPAMFEPLDLEMLECRREKFALLDTHDIDPCGTRTDHEVHFFVMRRRSGQMLRQCIRRDKHLDWRAYPALSRDERCTQCAALY